jgi:hypothetical protein
MVTKSSIFILTIFSLPLSALLKSHCKKTNCIEWNTLNGVQELTPADKKRAYQRITAFGTEWQKNAMA